MTSTQLYLPTVLPQWGIFAGIVLITIGYVDKKGLWTRIGWITLIITSLIALYFNFFGGLTALSEKNETATTASRLISTGWQAAAGGVLAIVSLVMMHYRSKRYLLLSILAICYYILTFFLYSQVSGNGEIKIQTEPKTELKQ